MKVKSRTLPEVCTSTTIESMRFTSPTFHLYTDVWLVCARNWMIRDLRSLMRWGNGENWWKSSEHFRVFAPGDWVHEGVGIPDLSTESGATLLTVNRLLSLFVSFLSMDNGLQLFPTACDGIFFDEAVAAPDATVLALYESYYEYAIEKVRENVGERSPCTRDTFCMMACEASVLGESFFICWARSSLYMGMHSTSNAR